MILPQLPPHIARPSRELAPVDVVRRRWIVLALVLLHLLGAVLVDRAMQLQALPQSAARDESIEVVFFDPPASAPVVLADTLPLPLAPAAAPAPTPAVVARAPPPAQPPSLLPAQPQTLAAPSAAPAAAQLDTLRLFNDDGSPRLSKAVIDAAQPVVTAPDFAAPQPQAIAPIRSPIPYKPTRLDEYWVPSNETLGAQALRRVIVEKEFKTPWGTTWRCAWILIIGGCGDVPPAAMKNPPKAPWETYQTEPETPRAVDFVP